MRGFSGVVNLLCSSPGTALHLLCSDARFANESFNLTGSSEPVESFETHLQLALIHKYISYSLFYVPNTPSVS